jgi:phosphopantothenoylcysteine decarboxylase / phosphopantothenate---cysteine ligase
MLTGVNVALGVTGSIAAVKVVELAHELRRRGANVRAVMSPSAKGIIHPWAVEFATDNPVVAEITGKVEHVELCGPEGWADVFCIAPATANTVGKIASAVDDTPVTTCATTALGADVPVVVAPAMHEPMYDHPGVLDAIERVSSWGVEFVDPRIEEGKAKIAAEDTIALEVARSATPSPLDGTSVVVTSGATSEPIDPIRVLTSRSSGKTGRAVARACYTDGANVALVHPGESVPYATDVRVETAAEMLDAVGDLVTAFPADALVSVAAISDYTTDAEGEKIRSGRDLSLDLRPTPKLIDEIRDDYPDLPIVGFKAEAGGDDAAMVAAARETLVRADLSFVVANDASVMGKDETRTLFVREQSVREYGGSKAELGRQVAKDLAEELTD